MYKSLLDDAFFFNAVKAGGGLPSNKKIQPCKALVVEQVAFHYYDTAITVSIFHPHDTAVILLLLQILMSADRHHVRTMEPAATVFMATYVHA